VSYTVSIRHQAQKELADVSPPFRTQILRKLSALADDPRPPTCTMLRGAEGIWRIRIGDYRVLYEIDDSAKTVIILKIAHRREAYR
jgi:mRNA interferase RelE/StbE